ncbi:MAG: methyltransferase domain-containing protein [Armatimonadota bacterium]|nr:MAG: methyltransferase domain-containing protein [Armatimonadota bacterium]
MQVAARGRRAAVSAATPGCSGREREATVASARSAAAKQRATSLRDDFYEKIKPRLYQRIGDELREARCVLDLGCGGCQLGRFLAETYSQQVIGVDMSDGSFPERHELRSRTRTLLRCVKADARRLGFLAAGAVDAEIMLWALHEIRQPRAVLVEARRVLRLGGKLLIADFPRGSLAQHLCNEDYYTPDQVSDLLAATGYVNISVGLVERRQVLWAKGLRSARKELTG